MPLPPFCSFNALQRGVAAAQDLSRMEAKLQVSSEDWLKVC